MQTLRTIKHEYFNRPKANQKVRPDSDFLGYHCRMICETVEGEKTGRKMKKERARAGTSTLATLTNLCRVINE